MPPLDISFSKHIVSPLEILQNGKENSSSNWDLGGPSYAAPGNGYILGTRVPGWATIAPCPAALAHLPVTGVWHVGQRGRGETPGLSRLLWMGAWERTESGKPAAQLQASVSLGECVPKAARQKVTRQGNPARSIPKPGKERGCPARAQTLGCLGWERRQRRLGCRGLALALLVPGCKRRVRKGKGEKEDRADTPLKAVRQKSSKLWG